MDPGVPGGLGYPELCGSPAGTGRRRTAGLQGDRQRIIPQEPKWIPSCAVELRANKSCHRKAGATLGAPLGARELPRSAPIRDSPFLALHPGIGARCPRDPPARSGAGGAGQGRVRGGGCSSEKSRERAAGARPRGPERGGARRGQPAPLTPSIPLHHHPLHNQPNHL